jgi:hypothetical protein
MNSRLLSPLRGWLAWLPLGSSRRGPPYCWGPRSQSASAPGRLSPPQERVDVDRATDVAVSALGREAFTGVLERGRRMSIEEAAGYTLSGGTVG